MYKNEIGGEVSMRTIINSEEETNECVKCKEYRISLADLKVMMESQDKIIEDLLKIKEEEENGQ